jgi:tetratricopeptide (TPR) repeat protein
MRIFVALATVAILTLPGAADDTETCAEAKVGDDGNAVRNACTRLIEQPGLSPGQRAQAHVNRAAQHQLWNDTDSAIADYGDAIRLDPDQADAYFERGTVYWVNKKDHDRAIADFNEVIRIEPQDARGYMGRGTAYSLKHDLEHALADYDTAIRFDPSDVPLFSLRALTYERKGDLNAALADYRHAATMTPRDWDEVDAVKQAADDVKRVEQLLAALGIQPTVPAPRLRTAPAPVARAAPAASADASDRASCENIGGVPAEAIMSCTRLIASGTMTGSELAAAHVRRGSHLGNASDRDGAIDDYSTALKIDPKSLAAYVGRALTYELKGDTTRALADYRVAATLDPLMKYARMRSHARRRDCCETLMQERIAMHTASKDS